MKSCNASSSKKNKRDNIVSLDFDSDENIYADAHGLDTNKQIEKDFVFNHDASDDLGVIFKHEKFEKMLDQDKLEMPLPLIN